MLQVYCFREFKLLCIIYRIFKKQATIYTYHSNNFKRSIIIISISHFYHYYGYDYPEKTLKYLSVKSYKSVPPLSMCNKYGARCII